MTSREVRASVGLAGIFGLRMLGLFLILPVFALAAPRLAGGDDLTLVGIALGAYGLAQAVLQIPFGMASDRWGRRPLIVAGLLIFALGSFVAASATDIWTVIAGRVLQGAGAISSVVSALAADLTREQHRTKTMAMIGGTIGVSFAASLVVAPILFDWIGLGGIFVLTGVLSLGAIWVLWSVVPAPAQAAVARPRAREGLSRVLRDTALLRLDFGIFVLHMVQMAMFVVVPARLAGAGLEVSRHWAVYLPAVLASFALMVPIVMQADRRSRARPVLLFSVALIFAAELGFAVAGTTLWALAACLVVFFLGFNVLEATLPSLVSRAAPREIRGTAMGVYNTTQTLGLFAGGVLGGTIAKHLGSTPVFVTCAALAAVWLAAAAGMRTPGNAAVNETSELTFSIGKGVNAEALRDALRGVPGVKAADVLAREGVAHLQVVPGEWDEIRVKKLISGEV